jgi:hypothetical protein
MPDEPQQPTEMIAPEDQVHYVAVKDNVITQVASRVDDPLVLAEGETQYIAPSVLPTDEQIAVGMYWNNGNPKTFPYPSETEENRRASPTTALDERREEEATGTREEVAERARTQREGQPHNVSPRQNVEEGRAVQERHRAEGAQRPVEPQPPRRK